ncbi:MAG: hypothetical protein QXS19_07670 [Candidatus Methanomethylicia archaeon]
MDNAELNKRFENFVKEQLANVQKLLELVQQRQQLKAELAEVENKILELEKKIPSQLLIALGIEQPKTTSSSTERRRDNTEIGTKAVRYRGKIYKNAYYLARKLGVSIAELRNMPDVEFL